MALRIAKPSDWEPYKDEVLNLFYHEGWTQKRIMEHMQEKYGLQASQRQYRTLREKSGKSKNIDSTTWTHILKHVERRRQAGKDSHVYWHQEKLGRERLVREEKRKRPLHQNSSAVEYEFLEIRTPSPMPMTPPYLPNEATSPAGSIQEDVNVDDEGSIYVPSAAMSEHEYGQLDTLVWASLVHGIPVFGRAINFFSELCGRPEQHMALPGSSIPRHLDYSWSWEALRCILADDSLRDSRQRVPGFPKMNTDLHGCSNSEILNIAINLIINEIHGLGLSTSFFPLILNWITEKRHRRVLQSILEARHHRLNPFAWTIIRSLGWHSRYFRGLLSLGDSQTEVMNMCYHSIKGSMTKQMLPAEASALLIHFISFPLPEVVSDLSEQGGLNEILFSKYGLDVYPSNLPVLQTILGDRMNIQIHFERWLDRRVVRSITRGIPQGVWNKIPPYIAFGVDLDRGTNETWPFTMAQILVVQSTELRQLVLSRTNSRLTLGLGNRLNLVREAGCLFSLSPVENELLLLLAARLNHLGLAGALIKSGTNPACDEAIVTLNEKSHKHLPKGSKKRARRAKRPMDRATEHRNSTMVKLLLEAGYEGPLDALLKVNMRFCKEVGFFSLLADTLQRSEWRKQAIVRRHLLDWAIVKADFGLLSSLLQYGIDDDVPSSCSQRLERLIGPLSFALIKSSTRMIKYLWQRGVRFRHQGSLSGAYELVLLCEEVRLGSLEHTKEKVEFLLEKGANPHELYHGLTPLQALFGGPANGRDPGLSRFILNIAGLLLSKGVDINSKNSDLETPLQYAVATGNFAGVRYLVGHGADINLLRRSTHMRDGSPLTELCRLFSSNFGPLFVSEQLSTIEFLLQNGAKIYQGTLKGVSDPLFAACEVGRLDIIQLLVRYGAVVKPQAAGSETSCSYIEAACESLSLCFNSNSMDVVRFLIDSGMDVNCVSSTGRSALPIACGTGNFDLVLLLLTAGADPNYGGRGQRDWECLPEAVIQGHYDIVRLLLNAGATTGFDDAIRLARGSGMFHMTQLLLSYRNQTVDSPSGSDIAGEGSSL